MFYRSGAGQWKKPSDAKTFSTAEDSAVGYVYPGYGYLISRNLWGDNLVVCDYKESSDINTSSKGNALRTFITDRLGMTIGHDKSNGVSENTSFGEVLLKYSNAYNATTKVVFASQLADTLSVIPEVRYALNYTDSYEEYKPQETFTNVYCMGEEIRSCYPAVIRGYKVMYNMGSNLQGSSIVESPLTGTRAFKFVENFGDTSQQMQVCAQGSGFTTGSTNMALVYCTSLSLDLYDGDINGFNPKQTWDGADSQNSHDAFVSAVNDNLDVGMTMKRFADKTAYSQVGEPYDMSFDFNKRIGSTSSKQIRIRYADGAINSTDRANVISEIASAYGVSSAEAETIFTNSGISGLTADNWYDEESDCLAITIHQSTISISDIILSDKSDYGNSTNQSATDLSSIGTTGVQCKFFLTISHINNTLSVDGISLDLTDKKYLINQDEMKGARFLVNSNT